MTYSVLIVEDEATLAANISRFLEHHGYDTRSAASAESGLAQLENFRPDAIVLDYNLPGMNGLSFLSRVRATDPQAKVIMATGHGSEQVAVDAMKAGAYDYLTKPLVLGRLKSILDTAVSEDRRDAQIRRTRQREPLGSGLGRVLGTSAPITALKSVIRRVLEAEAGLADTDMPAVLVTGETGTGKELVARALHFDGPRSHGPFVELNCSSIPASLLESELFGYERGAFTDARERKAGLIEAAEGGTLFLDEIGEMDLALQAKLLKFLEDRTVRRLGSVQGRHANVRVIAATNRSLEQEVREGRFRADLFFRLRMIRIATPALRTLGPDDIEAIARHFLKLHATRYGKPVRDFSAEALARLRRHDWPGNVRELRNLVEQSVILCPGEIVDAAGLGLESRTAGPCAELTAAGDKDDLNLRSLELRMLSQALEETAWNVTRAARMLGVSRDTLRYRIEKYGLRQAH